MTYLADRKGHYTEDEHPGGRGSCMSNKYFFKGVGSSSFRFSRSGWCGGAWFAGAIRQDNYRCRVIDLTIPALTGD